MTIFWAECIYKFTVNSPFKNSRVDLFGIGEDGEEGLCDLPIKSRLENPNIEEL